MVASLHRKQGEQFLDASGNPMAGGKLKYERAGTSTLLATYLDAAGTIPNTQTANRIILDSAGRLVEPVYIGADFDAKETLYTSADVVVSPWPFDNIPKAVDLGASLSDFAKPKMDWTPDSAAVINLTTADLGKGRIANTNANSITYNLPSAASAGNGKGILIKKGAAANTITLDGDGADTINGAATFSWTANNRAFYVQSDGSVWHVALSHLAGLTAPDVTPTMPTVQRFLSGASNYTPTSGTKWIKVRIVGAGGGGGGQSANNGANGGDTSFGSWTAKGGAGGAGGEASNTSGNQGGAGGTGGAAGTGTLIARFNGQPGSKVAAGNAAAANAGSGGNSVFGGGGQPGHHANAGGNALANTGSGGGGAAGNGTLNVGTGGGAGEYVEFLVNAPGVIAYSVGALGAGGAAGGSAGGDGAAGIIIIEEYY